MAAQQQQYHKKEIVTLMPETYNEVRPAADKLKLGTPALVNLSKLNPEERLWALHFLYGVIYAIDGETREIGNRVYLFTPANVAISFED